MKMDPMEHLKKQNQYALNLSLKFDFVFINFRNQDMVPNEAPECILMERMTTLKENLNNLYFVVF